MSEEQVDRSAYKFKIILPSGKKIKLESAQLPIDEFIEIQKLNGELLSGSSQSDSEPSQPIAWKKHEIENYSEYLTNPTISTTPNLNNPWNLPSESIFLDSSNYGPNQIAFLSQFRAYLCNQIGAQTNSMTNLKDLPFNLPNSDSPNSWVKKWIGNQHVTARSDTFCIRASGGFNRIYEENARSFICETKGCFSKSGVSKTELTCYVHKGSHKFFAAAILVDESFSQQIAKYSVHTCNFMANPDASDEERLEIFDDVNTHLYSHRTGDSTSPKLASIISQDRLEVQKFVCAWTYAIFLASMQPDAPDRPKISFYDIQSGETFNIFLPNLCEELMATILKDFFKLELRVNRLSKEEWAAAEWPIELGLQVPEEEQYANHLNGNIYLMVDPNVVYGGLNLSLRSKSHGKEASTYASPNLYQNALNKKLHTRAIILPTPLPDPQVEWTPEDQAKLEKEMDKVKSTGSRRTSTEAGKKNKVLEAKKQKILKPQYEKELRKIESIVIFSLQNLALFQLPSPNRSPLSANQIDLDTEETPNFTSINRECQFKISDINYNLFTISNAYCQFMTGFAFELVHID